MHTFAYFQLMPNSRMRHTPLTDGQLDGLVRRFRALASASRLRVLDALMSGPLTMGELGEASGLSQSNLSRQVTELELAGCVARDRRGREVEVRIADSSLKKLCELVCGSLARQAEAAHASLRRN